MKNLRAVKKRLLAALAILVFSVCGYGSGSPAHAALTNCSKWTSGSQGVSVCNGSTNYYPYTTKQVVVVTCKKWWWLGGGGYPAGGRERIQEPLSARLHRWSVP